MFNNAIAAIKGCVKLWAASPDEREFLYDTVSRLRQQPNVQNSSGQFIDDNENSRTRSASLFNTIGIHRAQERAALGRWCANAPAVVHGESSGPVDPTFHQTFDTEFDHLLNVSNDDTSLYSYMSKSAQHKALHGYIMNADLQRPFTQLAGAIDPAADELPPIIEISALSDTEELLLRFAHAERDEADRVSVAANEKAPAAAMWLLAIDRSALVKSALIENPKTPLAVLEILGKDFDGKVARKAQTKIRKLYSAETGIASGNLTGGRDAMDVAAERDLFDRHQAM